MVASRCTIRISKSIWLVCLFRPSYPRLGYSAPPSTTNYFHHPSIRNTAVAPNWPLGVFQTVRFFAAPVQVVKKEKKAPSEPLLNEQIKARIVRLVTKEGNFIVPRAEALHRASELDVDLVEVDHREDPPVCKLMDYKKERYRQKVKRKEREKEKKDTLKTGPCKEVRFSMKIEEKDLKVKADTAVKLMQQGYRVKCMATGSENQDLALLLSRFTSLIEGDSVVESGPLVESRQAYVVVRHAKFGPKKKGPTKAKAGPKMEQEEEGEEVNRLMQQQQPHLGVPSPPQQSLGNRYKRGDTLQRATRNFVR